MLCLCYYTTWMSYVNLVTGHIKTCIFALWSFHFSILRCWLWRMQQTTRMVPCFCKMLCGWQEALSGCWWLFTGPNLQKPPSVFGQISNKCAWFNFHPKFKRKKKERKKGPLDFFLFFKELIISLSKLPLKSHYIQGWFSLFIFFIIIMKQFVICLSFVIKATKVCV